MKKILIIALLLLSSFPVLTHATTVEEQYQSALREVIVLLQQQVALLIEQLNTLNAQTAKIEPSYTYTPIVTQNIIVPQSPTQQLTPLFGSVPQIDVVPTPSYSTTTVYESENASVYRLTSATSTPLNFTKATVKISPKTIVNAHSKVSLEVWFDDIQTSSPVYLIEKPDSEVTAVIPVKISNLIMPNKTVDIRVEVSAYGVSNPNDRYTIQLVSLE